MNVNSPFFKPYLKIKENWMNVSGFVGIIVSAYFALSATYLLFSPTPSKYTTQIFLAYLASALFYGLSTLLFRKNSQMNECRKIFNTLHYLDSKIRLDKIDLDTIKKIFFKLDMVLTNEKKPFFSHLKWSIIRTSDNRYYITHASLEAVVDLFAKVFIANPMYRISTRDFLIKLADIKDTNKLDDIIHEIKSEQGIQLEYLIDVSILGEEREKHLFLIDLINHNNKIKK